MAGHPKQQNIKGQHDNKKGTGRAALGLEVVPVQSGALEVWAKRLFWFPVFEGLTKTIVNP
jgi:hypothetical protein